MVTKKPITWIESFVETASYKMVDPQLKSQIIWGNTKAPRKLLVHVSTVRLIDPTDIVKGGYTLKREKLIYLKGGWDERGRI